MVDPCQPAVHAVARAIARPLRHVVHRVVGSARHAPVRIAPALETHPVAAVCIRAPGALPAGPGLGGIPIIGAFGVLGALAAAALLAGGLAAGGGWLGGGGGGGGGGGANGGRSSPVTAGQVSPGLETGQASKPEFDTAGELPRSPTFLSTELSPIWLVGTSGPTHYLPSFPSMPRAPATTPTPGAPGLSPPSATAPRAPDSSLPQAGPEQPTPVPEPPSQGILLVGSAATLLFRAALRRSGQSSTNRK